MTTNRLITILTSIALCSVIQLSTGTAYPQQLAAASGHTSQGVNLYTQGDMSGAIKVLREAVKDSEGDSRAWHYLGLALIRQGDLKEAREALNKAINLRRESFAEEDKRTGERVVGDQLLQLKSLLMEEIESRKRYLEINTDEKHLGTEQAQLDASQVRADCMERATKVDAGYMILRKRDLKAKKARILDKPEPSIPKQAERARERGMVVLRAVLAADRTVQHVRPIKSLGYGLTEEAIKAARRIKFEPASICGKPIISFVQIEYYFDLGR